MPDASASTTSAPDGYRPIGPQPRKGMAYVPPGALVAGSLPNSLPRRPDRELPGEQVMLKGFWIDRFAYPNEEGAIPATFVSQAEAQALCAKAGKRLCTELEWERACKGPLNHRYSWGDKYRDDACLLGGGMPSRPSGMRVGCHSDFDVYDQAGGVLEWTQSEWRRGASNGRVVLKGGNGTDGALMGRCANAEVAPATNRAQNIGFRCCAGAVNSAEVVIAERSGDVVERVERIDVAQFRRILEAFDSNEAAPPPAEQLVAERAFVWEPVSNDKLQVFVACTKSFSPRKCGVVVGRDTPSQPLGLGYADTGVVPSALHVDSRTEDIWLLGIDTQGRFKRLVRYQAGSIVVFPKERRIPKPPKKSGKKRRAHN